MERRSPTGIARERETRTDDAAPRRGAPVSDRHRAGARNPHQQRCAPPISLLRTTYCRPAGCPAPALLLLLNSPPLYGPCRCLRFVSPAALPRGCADQRSAFPCLRVAAPTGRRSPAFHTFPPVTRAANGVRCHLFFSRTRQCATTDMERRPVLPVGASDRHRAGARNPPRRRCAPPISLLRTAHRRSALNRGDGLERRPPVGTARRRRANHVLPTGGMSRTCTAAPVEVPVAVRTMPLFEVRLARRAVRGSRTAVPAELRDDARTTPMPGAVPFCCAVAQRCRCPPGELAEVAVPN